MATAETTQERREQRRAARREANRTQILDAAERVFGRVGLQAGSMREIADEAGFSSAALYLFFENRRQLLVETVARRTDELIALIESTIAATDEPLAAMHAIIDETLVFHQERRDFWRMLAQLRTVFAPPDAEAVGDQAGLGDRVAAIETLLTRLVRSGQRAGTIRRGDALVLARFYMVLNNEYITMVIEGTAKPTAAREFHAFIDDAFGARRSA